jgi:hypothetical protein
MFAGSARLSAQGFDGIIKFVSYENDRSAPDTMTQIPKGSKIRLEGFGHGEDGGGAMIMDGANRIVLIPSQKMWMSMPADFGEKEAAREASKQHGTAVKTGKSENVAGIPCEDWHYKGTKEDGSPEEGDACVAKGAGMMINKLSGGLAGVYFASAGQAFADAMKNGGGVMKVTENGKIAFVAVSVKATSVPDAMFAPPADYKKMSMPGMGKPN